MAANRPSYALCAWSVVHGRWAMLFCSPDLDKIGLFAAHLERGGSLIRIEASSSSVDDLEGARVMPLRRLS